MKLPILGGPHVGLIVTMPDGTSCWKVVAFPGDATFINETTEITYTPASEMTYVIRRYHLKHAASDTEIRITGLVPEDYSYEWRPDQRTILRALVKLFS